METNINYSLVGAFVITLIAATVLAIIWLSSGFSFEHFSTYMIYMQESVSGVSIDSPVEFNGVNVGSVSSITINHKNPQLVELLLKINSSTPVTQGTVATLNSRGVTGITYVALKDKSTDLRPLVAINGQPYPIIRTAPSLLMRLDTALNQLTTNLHEVSQSIQSVLDKDNQRLIRETLTNLQQITSTVALNSDRLTTILQNTTRASQQFTPLLLSSMSAMRAFESQTLPATYRMVSNLGETTRSISELANQLKQNPSMLIRGAASPPLGPGEVR